MSKFVDSSTGMLHTAKDVHSTYIMAQCNLFITKPDVGNPLHTPTEGFCPDCFPVPVESKGGPTKGYLRQVIPDKYLALLLTEIRHQAVDYEDTDIDWAKLADLAKAARDHARELFKKQKTELKSWSTSVIRKQK